MMFRVYNKHFYIMKIGIIEVFLYNKHRYGSLVIAYALVTPF